jgi:hypothetical protein
MTAIEAKQRIERHLVGSGYRRTEGQKHTYLLHSDGVYRWKLTSRTVQRQKHFEGGWLNISRAASLIEVAKRLDRDGA